MKNQLFICEACNVSYKQKRNLSNHLRNHFEKYICEYCSLQFSYDKLQQHIVSVHETHRRNLPYNCRFCARKFPTAVFRNSHERDVHKGRKGSAFECLICNSNFLKKDHLRLHNLEYHHSGSVFLCPHNDCDRFFKTIKLLKIHEKIHGTASYQCKSCKKCFKQSSNYSKHKRRCKGPGNEKTYTEEELEAIAEIARKQFYGLGGKSNELENQSENVEKNAKEILYLEEFEEEVMKYLTTKDSKYINGVIDIKKSEKPLKSSVETLICDRCAKQFDSGRNFRKHMWECTREITKSDSIKPLENISPIPSKSPPSLKCSVYDCNLLFKSQGNLTKHIQHVHLNERTFQCDKCAKFFKTKYHLKIHLKIHGIPKECPICSIVLPNIEAHIKRHIETKQSTFNCKQCGRSCATKQALLEHIQRIHERKSLGRLYKCPICHEHFIRNCDLRRHSFSHYQGKVYCCTHPGCSDMFKSSYKLQLHTVIHNQKLEKKFVCEECNKSFLRQTSLYKHRKLHLKHMNAKPAVSIS